MVDITAVGEILIDLTQTGLDEQGIPQFAANPGGAPANLAVAAARLGASTAFVGKVGKDSFGDFLRGCLVENSVDVGGMVTDPVQHTTLAVVSLDPSGERNFSFYRASLWSDEATAVEQMLEPLPLVDILKVSDEELPLLTGTGDLEAGSALLAEKGISLVLVTLGPDGAFYRFRGQTGLVPGVPCKVGDTNGAGDTFFGAALSELARLPSLDELTVPELERIVTLANRAASLTTSRHGAIPAMPTMEEVMA